MPRVGERRLALLEPRLAVGIAGQPVASAEQAARTLREGANRAQAVQVQREGRSLFLALPAAQG